MPLWIHRNLPLVLSVAFSLLVHVTVLLPMTYILGLGQFNSDEPSPAAGKALPGMKGPTLDPETAKKLETPKDKPLPRKEEFRKRQRENLQRIRQMLPQEPLKPQDPPQDTIELGIDGSTANTMNWIGYAEYEQHLAQLAEVEQAAFRLQASSGSGGKASPNFAPAPPGPAVAMSPNPGPLPLPPTAGGTYAPQQTSLVVPPSVSPASPLASTANTNAQQATGADAERARPAPPPERLAETGTAGDSNAKQPPSETPTDTPSTDPTNDPDAPLPPAPDPESAGEQKPAPKPADPAHTDPEAATIAKPAEKPEPSKIDPTKSLDPAASGASANLPPRESADTKLDSTLPPIDAPVNPSQPSTDPTMAANKEPSVDQRPPTENPANPAPTPEQRGGGVKGPEVVQGATNTGSMPSPAGIAGDQRADNGALSTRESDPTSTIDVPQENWRNGKPLARAGIKLDTVRPKFTALNQVVGIRQNPIAELRIGRDGVPQNVRLVRFAGGVQMSAIDDAIVSALYKWRASGKQLERLAPGQTVTVRLKLIMLAD